MQRVKNKSRSQLIAQGLWPTCCIYPSCLRNAKCRAGHLLNTLPLVSLPPVGFVGGTELRKLRKVWDMYAYPLLERPVAAQLCVISPILPTADGDSLYSWAFGCRQIWAPTGPTQEWVTTHSPWFVCDYRVIVSSEIIFLSTLFFTICGFLNFFFVISLSWDYFY